MLAQKTLISHAWTQTCLLLRKESYLSLPRLFAIEEKWIEVKRKSVSCVWLFVTPWTVCSQALLCMEFSRSEYWGRLPCPPPGHLPNPGIELRSPALQVDSLPSSQRSFEAKGRWNVRDSTFPSYHTSYTCPKVLFWILYLFYSYFPPLQNTLMIVMNIIHLSISFSRVS